MPLVRGCCSHRARALPALLALLFVTHLAWGYSISWDWWARKHREGAVAEAVVLLYFAAASPMSQAGAVLITPRTHACMSTHIHTHAVPRSATQRLSRPSVGDESSLSWYDIETSEGDETVAAVAVGCQFCSWDSCGRNNCCPCPFTPPAQEQLSRAGRGCSRFPFLSHPSSTVGFLAKWLSIPLAWEQELKWAAPDSA